ncbi:MAG: bifunctional phosphopantothenoylcysteine decarboxylase/phosphopantothenate--cysteine ligase CoaBC [Gammaproteobacteria bacterium]|jgi:phosphopantothenoylcysteine decarboxylase/phosphopantothenate--cysteine ligase|nr:bifunctional phosphopantothenoylcysteine decarboxylase/phosphopantothenate--cysteine ligase CoaBC [Gammaproteobacteria bacterium]
MSRLFNKHIIVAISGGIAAYKSAELVRLLKTAGAQVEVVMTRGAIEFITPLTLQALSGNPVHQHLLDPAAEAGMGHIQLARWADAILVAPCTAQVMARLAQGQADDLLSTLCLATQAPVLLAPAMNQAMWNDPATQANAQLLIERGLTLLGPDVGEQACGDVGPGRMLEPGQLVIELEQIFSSHAWQGRKVVITAGPTREAIDPVRYLSNHSSGKMGYALAQAAVEAGAQVHLISGPTNLPTPIDLQCTQVQSARDMLSACQNACQDADIFIASAAVADYRPAEKAEQKIKKTGAKSGFSLELVQNPDILATIAADFPRLTCVGFAAETQQLVAHAQAKLKRKQVAMIIANDVSEPGIGFNSDENQVCLVTAEGAKQLPRLPKTQLARQLINHIAQLDK